ncbi:hypothetical protein [Nocardioides aurantiacus]|uniref:hypothetical protein n=1 Tax=Nocardioides aurantiacus TaxID=86796 RepID=UPI0011CDC8EC|nr:hypothetical protein [Nocardioides aurantiacus]
MPLTWEPFAMVAALWGLGSALSLPLGQGLALCAVGQGFQWPEGQVLDSLVGLANGDPGVGLRSPPPTTLTYASALSVWLIGTGVLLVLATVGARALGLSTAGRGLAGRAEIAATLGPAALRRRARVIRPDLFGRRRNPRGTRE